MDIKIKTTISEMKNTLYGINDRGDTAEEKFSAPDDTITETT